MFRPISLEEISRYLETNEDDEIFYDIKVSDFEARLQSGRWQDPEDQLDDARLTAICHEVLNDWMCAENCHNRSLYFDML